jgi:hypothetical protein
MHIRYLALAAAGLMALAACTEAGDTAGAVRDVEPTPDVPLYSPISRDALALGLPNLVGPQVLLPSTSEKIEYEESEFVTDPRVRQVLVQRGLGGSMVMVEQKSARVTGPPTATERIPRLALTAAQIKQVPATELIEWDPTFYLYLTTVDLGDYEWQGEKPDDYPVTIDGREVRVADFGRFKVGWYAYGDVLYVIVADNDDTLEDAVERLPWSTFAI